MSLWNVEGSSQRLALEILVPELHDRVDDCSEVLQCLLGQCLFLACGAVDDGLPVSEGHSIHFPLRANRSDVEPYIALVLFISCGVLPTPRLDVFKVFLDNFSDGLLSGALIVEPALVLQLDLATALRSRSGRAEAVPLAILPRLDPPPASVPSGLVHGLSSFVRRYSA